MLFDLARPLASQFILLVLATSIASQIGADELFHAGAYVDSRTFRSFEVYAVITAVYLILALIFLALFGAPIAHAPASWCISPVGGLRSGETGPTRPRGKACEWQSMHTGAG